MRTVSLLVLVACNPFREGAVSGRLEGKGTIGSWTFEQGTCYSGQREQYFGVIGYGPDGSGIAVKLVKDGVRGWTAVVNQAENCKAEVEKGGCHATVFAPNDCTTLDVDIHDTNTTINDIRAVDGTAKVDCSNDGGAIKGTLTFDRCH